MASRSSDQAPHILITGGSGFLGSHIVSALATSHPSWKLSILDLHPPAVAITGTYLQADITSRASVVAAFSTLSSPPDAIIHTAGIVPARSKRYSQREEDWEVVRKINFEGTVHVVEAGLAIGCTYVVYTSSCTVVMDDLDHDYFLVDETVATGHATLQYGRSKALAENWVLSGELQGRGLRACALRPATVVGEGDTAVIGLLHDLIGKGETRFIVGDGDNFYDFVYVGNAALAHRLAVEALLRGDERVQGQAFNISNQEPVYFWDFLAAVWAHFGHVPPWRVRIPVAVAWLVGFLLECVTWWTGAATTMDRGSVKDAVRTHYADNSKAVRLLGYRPTVGMVEGLRRSCEFYKGVLAQREKDVKERKGK